MKLPSEQLQKSEAAHDVAPAPASRMRQALVGKPMDEQVQMLAPEGAGVGKGPAGAPAKEARQAFREAKRDDRKNTRTDAAIARDEARGVGMGDAGAAKTSETPTDEAAPTMVPLTPDAELSLASVAAHARRELMDLYGRLLTHSHIAGPHTTTPALQISMVPPALVRSENPLALGCDLTGYFQSFARVLRQHMHVTTNGHGLGISVIDHRLDTGIHGESPGAIEAEFHALLAILRDAIDGHVHMNPADGRASSPPIGTAAYDAANPALQGQGGESPDGR